jgi:hypothetical protein
MMEAEYSSTSIASAFKKSGDGFHCGIEKSIRYQIENAGAASPRRDAP